jgi:cell division septation protein DedD
MPAAVAPRPRLAPADLPRGYYINVGLFAVLDNGINAHRKLESAGLPALSDSVTSRKGELTRVRVGPFATRAQADAAAKKILALKLEAVVFRH